MARPEPSELARLQQHDELGCLHPSNRSTNVPRAKSVEPVYVADGSFAPDEGEPPETPFAACVELEETPNAKHAREWFEARSKAPQQATTSNRLKRPMADVDVISGATFSFKPMHRPANTMQNIKRRSPSQPLSAGEEAESHNESHTKALASPREPESQRSPEVDPMIDQPNGNTPRDNAEIDFDGNSMSRQDSSGTEPAPVQEKPTTTEVLFLREDGSRHVANENTLKDHNVYGDPSPYSGQDISRSGDDEVQLNFAPSPQDLQHAQEVQSSSTDDEDVIDLTESLFANEHTSPNSVTHHSVPAGAAPIHDGRVSKTTRRCRLQPAQNPHFHQWGNATSVQQPSEEDLLFLLMSRARDHNESRKRLASLEYENKNLRHEKVQTDSELQQAVSARDEYAQDYSLLNQNLDKFKEKYYKLKKWALETNKDCEMLQDKASGFQKALSDLAKDRNQLLTQLQDVRSSSSSAAEQLENVRNGVHDVKVLAEDRIASVNQLSNIVTDYDDKLRAERQRSKKLELHIIHLEKERDKQNVRVHGQHQMLNQTLQIISGKLDTLQNGRAEDNSEKDCMLTVLGRIQSVLDNDLMTKSDMLSLKEDIESTTTSLSKAENSISGILQEAIASLKDDLQNNVSAQATKLLSTVQSDNGPLIEAKIEVARLEQKAQQTKEMMKLLKDAKTAAEENGASLRKMMDNLNNTLGNDKEAARKQANDLSTMVNTLTTKWQTASSQLERCKEERKKEEKESQAEINDLLVGLTEAMGEQNCLRSELTKADDLFNEIRQQNEQQHVETVDRMTCQLSNLQDDLDHEIQQQAEAQDEIGSLRVVQSQLQRDLEKSQEETDIATRDLYALQDEIIDLEQRLDRAEEASKRLEEAAMHLKEVTDELNYVKQQQPSLEQLKKKSLSQQQEIETKSQEFQSLSKEIVKQQARSAQLEDQVREKDKLAEENAVIHKQLEELRKEVSVMADLQRRVQQQDTKVTELQSALVASREHAQEKDKLAKENAAIHKQLRELREEVSMMADVQMRLEQKNTKVAELEAALTAAQDQAAKITQLQASNTSLKEAVVSLSSDLEEVNEECAQIVPLKETIKTKDDELAELQKQVASLNAQVEEVEKLRDDLQRKEEEYAGMQQQILSLEGALSNAKLDREANQPQQQRRVADRSGTTNMSPKNQLRHSHLDASSNGVRPYEDDILHLVGSSAPLAGVTTIVPETQLEVQESPPVEPDSLILPPGQQQEDSESELSPLPGDDDEDAGVEDEIEPGVVNTQRHAGGQGHASLMKATSGSARNQEPAEQLPSSSYESQSDQMLLDQESQGESQIVNSLPSADTTPGFAMPSNRIISRQEPSPRRLRSGSQGLGLLNTASPEPDGESQRHRASTPAVMRERYQPNSAAKRRVEPEIEEHASKENPKRLKRRPANFEVKKPQTPTSKQGAEQTPSRGAVSFRKSSSIVGTNAPSPGKSQRHSKPGRKGFRQDKYATRFAVEI